ncbi:hypothetical protein TSOC_006400 [Tetrabaena socialis]|uniref:Uncharacterized protein n=1 Tax=Tetrabaena socialis TaxID=47790 RepID=A0A2J8A3R9_9CHLO|nr:hypothetical protein TSOC_006400 [Tetrabaena socialis]|eukprot:PNH07153.1 hypothetical protein TSOC_006400 [Tetrabaena socialis]
MSRRKSCSPSASEKRSPSSGGTSTSGSARKRPLAASLRPATTKLQPWCRSLRPPDRVARGVHLIVHLIAHPQRGGGGSSCSGRGRRGARSERGTGVGNRSSCAAGWVARVGGAAVGRLSHGPGGGGAAVLFRLLGTDSSQDMDCG